LLGTCPSSCGASRVRAFVVVHAGGRLKSRQLPGAIRRSGGRTKGRSYQVLELAGGRPSCSLGQLVREGRGVLSAMCRSRGKTQRRALRTCMQNTVAQTGSL